MKLNKIKVIVAGFRGKMGATAVQMILNAQNFELVALLGKKKSQKRLEFLFLVEKRI